MARNRTLKETVFFAELFSIYGELLPPKQQEFFNLYYIEDLSLSEIASQYNISRQAVHDALHQGKSTLDRYERILGVYNNLNNINVDSKIFIDKESVMNMLDDIKKIIKMDLIYDTDTLRSKFKKLEDLLK